MGSNLGYWFQIHCDSKIILIHMFGENTTIPALDILCFAPVECGECDKRTGIITGLSCCFYETWKSGAQ